jgi:hypothetical protein
MKNIRFPLFALLALTLIPTSFAGETKVESKPFGNFTKITVSGEVKDCEKVLAEQLELASASGKLVTSAVGCGAEAVYWGGETLPAGSLILRR